MTSRVELRWTGSAVFLSHLLQSGYEEHGQAEQMEHDYKHKKTNHGFFTGQSFCPEQPCGVFSKIAWNLQFFIEYIYVNQSQMSTDCSLLLKQKHISERPAGQSNLTSSVSKHFCYLSVHLFRQSMNVYVTTSMAGRINVSIDHLLRRISGLSSSVNFSAIGSISARARHAHVENKQTPHLIQHC